MSIQSKTIDNEKKFWKTVKPLFSIRNPMCEKITLIENGKILSNDEEIAECFNEYFTNITDSPDSLHAFKGSRAPSLRIVKNNSTVLAKVAGVVLR